MWITIFQLYHRRYVNENEAENEAYKIDFYIFHQQKLSLHKANE